MELNEQREVVGGSFADLAQAIKRGATVRCCTTFDYGEHMCSHPEEGFVEENMDFAVAYWLEGDRSAAIEAVRFPANASLGFGATPSLSFFLNNDCGQNGIGRPIFAPPLPDAPARGKSGSITPEPTKYHGIDSFDADTRYPSSNFTYDFGYYKWYVDERWEMLGENDAQGNIVAGSLADIQEASRFGCDIRVGVQGLCNYLSKDSAPMDHWVFVDMGPMYNHQDAGYIGGESRPLVRLAPNAPMVYRHGNWDFGWILPRTDGVVHCLRIDPATREFIREEVRLSVKWFAR